MRRFVKPWSGAGEGRLSRAALELPGDKSLSQRALILAFLSGGPCRVRGLSGAGDVRATAQCLQRLGLDMRPCPGGGWHLRRLGRIPRYAELNCANSGTGMRLMCGLLAGWRGGGSYILRGDASLCARPMERVAAPLRLLHGMVETEQGHAPLHVTSASLRWADIRLDKASAQVKSALLLAGLQGEGVSLLEPGLSRDHTERMLRSLGVPLQEEITVTALGPQRRLELAGPYKLPAFDFCVPGDVSSACFWLVLACAKPGARLRLRGVSLNPGRLGFVGILRRMGATVSTRLRAFSLGEPWGDLEVQGGALQGVEVEPALVPSSIDELPLLAFLACLARGRTQVRGAGELRFKESDRLQTTAEAVQALGGDIELVHDGFIVEGHGCLRGGAARCYGDHRLEMGLAVAGALSRQGVLIEDCGCSAVSYPDFWSACSALGLEYADE